LSHRDFDEKWAEKAVECFHKSWAQAYPKAGFNLGVCYDKGIGVPENKAKASELYAKAAELDDMDAKLFYTYRMLKDHNTTS